MRWMDDGYPLFSIAESAYRIFGGRLSSVLSFNCQIFSPLRETALDLLTSCAALQKCLRVRYDATAFVIRYILLGWNGRRSQYFLYYQHVYIINSS